MLLAFRLGLIISVVPIIVALALVGASKVAGAPMAQAVDSPVSLETTATDLLVGEEFEVDIVLDASLDVPVSAAQAYLNFNADVLQVVDADGNPATTITPGNVFAPPPGPGPEGSTGNWTDVLQNSVTTEIVGDDNVGQVNFAGGKGTPDGGGTNATDTFTLATVRFKALAESASTDVTFNTSGLRETKVVSGFNDVTGALSPLTLSIADLVDVTLNFTLEGGSDGVPEWTMPFEVEFYAGGTAAGTPVVEIPLAVVATNPSTGGASSFGVLGVIPGTYDIWVKGENTLAKLFENVTISSTSNVVDLGEQVGGDATGTGAIPDNIVDISDYDLFIALSDADKFPADVANDPDLTDEQRRADFDQTNVIDSEDYGQVLENFDLFGVPQPGTP